MNKSLRLHNPCIIKGAIIVILFAISNLNIREEKFSECTNEEKKLEIKKNAEGQ